MDFNVRKTRFLRSYADAREINLPDLPQIAIAGRSNVGKSSLINALCENKKLARTSQTPGKTRLLNIFDMDSKLYLVDLPGYGYAKVSREEQLRWADMLERYLRETESLTALIQLVDIRHDPSADDVSMMQWIRAADLPYHIIATKADKISKSARARQIQAICRKLVVQPWEVTAWSSEDGTGKQALRDILAGYAEKQADDETDLDGVPQN